MNLMDNSQMDRGNENPTQQAMIKSQSGWLGPGFELEVSQIRIQCVATAPSNSVAQLLFCRISSR